MFCNFNLFWASANLFTNRCNMVSYQLVANWQRYYCKSNQPSKYLKSWLTLLYIIVEAGKVEETTTSPKNHQFQSGSSWSAWRIAAFIRRTPPQLLPSSNFLLPQRQFPMNCIFSEYWGACEAEGFMSIPLNEAHWMDWEHKGRKRRAVSGFLTCSLHASGTFWKTL